MDNKKMGEQEIDGNHQLGMQYQILTTFNISFGRVPTHAPLASGVSMRLSVASELYYMCHTSRRDMVRSVSVCKTFINCPRVHNIRS